jgi:NAD(P)-dependent dehydrogenase (short-subunit alcohol dehydrogenase family)
MRKLTGKVAIVTGARQGIGVGIAKVFARHDAIVVLTSDSSSGVRFRGYDSAGAFEMCISALAQKNQPGSNIQDVRTSPTRRTGHYNVVILG